KRYHREEVRVRRASNRCQILREGRPRSDGGTFEYCRLPTAGCLPKTVPEPAGAYQSPGNRQGSEWNP
ncbi:MAG: hypothetical protein ACR2L2_09420, partial [Acidobacteriota bacterium]